MADKSEDAKSSRGRKIFRNNIYAFSTIVKLKNQKPTLSSPPSIIEEECLNSL